ncbi:MAG: hypothetical protein AAB719_02575 [Patescibacteria group bacterium]
MALFNKRNLVIGILVVLVAALAYRYVVKPETEEADSAFVREVSTIASFEVPDGTDKVRFTLGLDDDGRVISVKTTDVLAGDTADEHMVEFSNNLLVMIQGKKLSELTNIDRVGTSSLTTKAFNSSLPALKAQI